MSLRQPKSMQNYTEMGFKKIKAPEAVFKLIKDFWDSNKDKASEENWSTGNTYTNHWVANTDFVSIENPALRGGGALIKRRIWDAARNTLQEWVGQELTECSLYGIRIYKEGSVLATHVDRLPLVTSAIINVDQVRVVWLERWRLHCVCSRNKWSHLLCLVLATRGGCYVRNILDAILL